LGDKHPGGAAIGGFAPPQSHLRLARLAMLITCVGATLALRPGLQPNPKSANTSGSASVTETSPAKTYGSQTAPITFEVFSDYQCPQCRNLFEQTLRPMIADYVASGKVYLIHRDYPLARLDHKYSGQAARWGDAAARIGQFAAVEAALYDNAPAWEADGNIEKYVAAALSPTDFKRVQKLMQGCDPPGPAGRPDSFIAAPHPCSIDSSIQQDILLGNRVPVNATPTFVITYKGQRLPSGTGFVSWPVLKQFLDNLLGQ
jgi:protein-disulfide isomerase